LRHYTDVLKRHIDIVMFRRKEGGSHIPLAWATPHLDLLVN